MVSDWFPTGFGQVSDWFPTGFRLVSDWFQTGFRLVSDWFPIYLLSSRVLDGKVIVDLPNMWQVECRYVTCKLT